MDGCIYYKDQIKNEEYCFGLVEQSESAILQCEVKKNHNYLLHITTTFQYNGTVLDEDPCENLRISFLLKEH